ncbi:MAG: TonB-dependent receptor [Cytophagales bacterium]|nr:TonB-dependent receptor [Cytophagales bacterium]
MRKNLLLIALCAGIGTQAQDSLKTTRLNEVIVTANRVETPLAEIDRSVEIITADQINQSSYQNVAELISAYASGIYIVGQQQNVGASQSLFVRGTNSNHINILVNGIRLTDPSSPGGSLDLSELSLLNVERIEILKGSHGSMYGSSGVGGVLNIITKKVEDGWQINGDGQMGTFGKSTTSYKQRLEVTYSFENGFYIGGGAENWRVKGLDATLDTINTQGVFDNPDRDDFEKRDFFGRIGYSGNSDQVEIMYKNTSQETDLDKGAFEDDENYTLDYNRDFVSYNWQHNFRGVKIQLTGGYTSMSRASVNDSSAVDTIGNTNGSFSSTNNEGNTLTNEFQTNWGKGKFDFLSGFGHVRDRMNTSLFSYSSFFGPFELSTDGLESKQIYSFARSTVDFGGIRLGSGTRLTDHDAYGKQWSFDFTPSLKIGNESRLYLSYNSGFNNPSLFQLYDPTYGTSGLKPEKSKSIELGFDSQITDEFNFGISLYKNQIEDAIEFVYLWNPDTQEQDLSYLDDLGGTYINLSELNSSGLEFKLDYSVDQLSFSMNYSYLIGDFSYSAEDIDRSAIGDSHVQLISNGDFLTGSSGSSLVRRPGEMLNLRSNYSINHKWNIGLRYSYVGKREDVFYDPTLGPYGSNNTLEVKEYGLLDLNSSYQLNKTWMFAFRIENLLDNTYQEIRGYTTRGRGVYLKVLFNLSEK